MPKNRSPKWSIEDDINYGQQAFELATQCKTDLQNRFKPGFIEELGAEVETLKARQSGQQ